MTLYGAGSRARKPVAAHAGRRTASQRFALPRTHLRRQESGRRRRVDEILDPTLQHNFNALSGKVEARGRRHKNAPCLPSHPFGKDQSILTEMAAISPTIAVNART